jgi:hypothetical protein
MIIEQYTDMAGKVRIQWQSTATGHLYTFKFNHTPELSELQALSDQSDESQMIQAVQPLSINTSGDEQAIRSFIDKIRQMPTITLTQYNNYLNTLLWNDAASVRAFVYNMAKGLSDRGEIMVLGWTEGTVLREVRDYINANTDEVINRLIF